MKCFWIIWLFALLILNTSGGRAFKGMNLKEILLAPVEVDNKLAECLLSMVQEYEPRVSTNVHIRIETKSQEIRENFLNVMVKFLVKNNRSTIDLASEWNTKYDIHFRMYFIDSVQSFHTSVLFRKEQRNNYLLKDQFYLIILPKGIPEHSVILKDIFEVCLNLSIINANALFEDHNGSITLYTYFPYNKDNCRDSSPKILNSFANGRFIINKSNFPRKTDNFWNCPLKVILWEEPPFSQIKHGKISGYDGLLLDHLAEMLNFSVELLFPRECVGNMFGNRSVPAGFKMLNDGIGDLYIGDLVCTETRQKLYASSPYNTYYKKLVFRSDIPHQPIKMLILPLDQTTWLVVLAIAIGKWFSGPIWNKVSKNFKHQKDFCKWFVVGPYLINVFLIRSLYEGSLFKILHNKPMDVLPNSLEEAIDQGYKFMVTSGGYNLSKVIPELTNHMVVFNESNILDCFFQNDKKFVFLASDEHMAIYSNGRKYFIAQQPLLSISTCMYWPKFSFMAREFNKRIEYLTTHGYKKKIMSLFLEMNLNVTNPVSEVETYFAMEHLMGAFHFFLIFVAVSSLIFVIEVLSKRKVVKSILLM